MRRMKMKTLLAVPMLGVLLAGCYTMEPVTRAKPEIGSEVAVDLNDAGRAALGPSIGREVAQVHGHLVQRDSNAYLLAVTYVQFLRGGSQSWTGENVRVQSDYTDAYYENRLSKPRSVALAAAFVGGAVLLAQQALNLSPGTNDGSGPDTPPDTKQRVPKGIRIPLNAGATIKVMRGLLPMLAKF